MRTVKRTAGAAQPRRPAGRRGRIGGKRRARRCCRPPAAATGRAAAVPASGAPGRRRAHRDAHLTRMLEPAAAQGLQRRGLHRFPHYRRWRKDRPRCDTRRASGAPPRSRSRYARYCQGAIVSGSSTGRTLSQACWVAIMRMTMSVAVPSLRTVSVAEPPPPG